MLLNISKLILPQINRKQGTKEKQQKSKQKTRKQSTTRQHTTFERDHRIILKQNNKERTYKIYVRISHIIHIC